MIPVFKILLKNYLHQVSKKYFFFLKSKFCDDDQKILKFLLGFFLWEAATGKGKMKFAQVIYRNKLGRVKLREYHIWANLLPHRTRSFGDYKFTFHHMEYFGESMESCLGPCRMEI